MLYMRLEYMQIRIDVAHGARRLALFGIAGPREQLGTGVAYVYILRLHIGANADIGRGDEGGVIGAGSEQDAGC